MHRRTFLTLAAAAAGLPLRHASFQASSQPSSQSASHLQVRGAALWRGTSRFEWRGISAFRLAEMIANSGESDAVRFLDWAASQKLTVVRVFLMARHLFQLPPDRGVAALPRLLELSAVRGLHVEAVALADTLDVPVDYARHLAAIADVAARHSNAIVEIANEPWHPTQDKRLHDPSFVAKLAAGVPASIPVALGSVEGHDGYAAGRFITWHSPRSSSQDGWGHVLALAEGAALLDKWKKPIVSDEPIGAAAQAVPGRRDNDPRRFAAAGALTRLIGLGATFHYEGGLQAIVPTGRELECLTAWRRGVESVAAVPEGGRFLQGSAVAELGTIAGARAPFGRVVAKQGWVVAIDPTAKSALTPAKGWKQDARSDVGGAVVYRLVRT